MEWYLQPLKKYADFSGRARRREYWTFALINGVISGILSTLGSYSTLFTVLGGLFSLAVLIPGLAVAFRRLHDVGKSGKWILICLVPLVGWIIYLITVLKDSEGDNQYGPNPKNESSVG